MEHSCSDSDHLFSVINETTYGDTNKIYCITAPGNIMEWVDLNLQSIKDCVWGTLEKYNLKSCKTIQIYLKIVIVFKGALR